MRKILISLSVLIFASSAIAVDEQDTVKVWSVDYKGKPPFKRTLKRLPVDDIAQFETAEEVETVAVRVKKGAKPPFKRLTVNLPVVDAAQLETEDGKSKPDFRGKPPFKR